MTTINPNLQRGIKQSLTLAPDTSMRYAFARFVDSAEGTTRALKKLGAKDKLRECSLSSLDAYTADTKHNEGVVDRLPDPVLSRVVRAIMTTFSDGLPRKKFTRKRLPCGVRYSDFSDPDKARRAIKRLIIDPDRKERKEFTQLVNSASRTTTWA